MARHHVGASLLSLFFIFLAILFTLPYIKKLFPQVSGFNDINGGSCEEGRTPCKEGYFCQVNKCVPILPNFDINNVKPCDNC
jgi:hypothetical protein